MCLDVLRALGKAPEARAALAQELGLARGRDARYDAWCLRLQEALAAGADSEFGARRLAEQLVVGVQAALLLRHAPACVADAFVASRIERDVGGAFGRLPEGVDAAAILARALENSSTR
jgi:putative acyl-CoA dehydrogenase